MNIRIRDWVPGTRTLKSNIRERSPDVFPSQTARIIAQERTMYSVVFRGKLPEVIPNDLVQLAASTDQEYENHLQLI